MEILIIGNIRERATNPRQTGLTLRHGPNKLPITFGVRCCAYEHRLSICWKISIFAAMAGLNQKSCQKRYNCTARPTMNAFYAAFSTLNYKSSIDLRETTQTGATGAAVNQREVVGTSTTHLQWEIQFLHSARSGTCGVSACVKNSLFLTVLPPSIISKTSTCTASYGHSS